MKRFCLLIPCLLGALPEGEQVAHGQAAFTRSENNTLTINAADKTIINYARFDIAEKETVHFQMRGPKSTVLNRVQSANPSRIFGKIRADGKVFLVNPNGIIFGPHSEVNVGSLIASTLDIEDGDFIQGKYRFTLRPGSKGSQIVNQGHLQAVEHGLVALIAPHILNSGTIVAHAGKVVMLGGEVVTIDFSGDGLISFAVEGELESSIVEHLGKIIAPQGEVLIRLNVVKDLLKNMINLDGLKEGTQIVKENGVIRIVAESGIDADTVAVVARNIEASGNVSARDSFALIADETVRMRNGSAIGDLAVSGKVVALLSPIECARLHLHAEKEFQVGANIRTNNSPVEFDAPVVFLSSDITMGTGSLGGNIVFQQAVNRDPRCNHVNLTLAAGSGDIVFNGPVGNIERLLQLTIVNAGNVSCEDMFLGAFIQSAGTGTSAFKGRIDLDGTLGLHLNCHVANFDGDVAIPQAGMTIQNSGTLKIAEKTHISVAQDFLQKGRGEVILGGNIVCKEGTATFHGPTILIGDVRIDTSAGKGNIAFHANVEGPGGLDVSCGDLIFHGDMGRASPLSSLKAMASGVVSLSNIGGQTPGVTGPIHLAAKDTILFRGHTYHAGSQIYRASKVFQMLAEKPTVFTAASSNNPILFEQGEVSLSAGTDLSIFTANGQISIGSVRSARSQRLTLQSQSGAIHLQSVGLGDDIDYLTISGGEVFLGGPIRAHWIAFNSKEKIHVKGDIAALEGNLVFSGPVSIEHPKVEFSAGRHGDILFHSTLDGQGELGLVAKGGMVAFGGAVGSRQKFARLTVNAQTIHQKAKVKTTGSIVYTGEIHLGDDLYTMRSAITFNGPVFCNRDIRMSTGVGPGDVIFMSTLDGSNAGLSFSIDTSEGNIYFRGSIGTKGPLRELHLIGSKVSLHDIGTPSQAGVYNLSFSKPFDSIELHGNTYHIGPSQWRSENLHLLGEGEVRFLTDGSDLLFDDTPVRIHPGASLAVDTGGGDVQFSIVDPLEENALTIRAGRGEWISGVFVRPAGVVAVEARAVELQGPVWVRNLSVSAQDYIQVGKIMETSATHIVNELAPVWARYPNGTIPHIVASGDVFFNVAQGSVGEFQVPVVVEIKGLFTVGASKIADLKGVSGDGMVHSHPGNPPQLIIFNDQEFYDVEVMGRRYTEDDIISLTPDLTLRGEVGKLDGALLTPRSSPVFYEQPPAKVAKKTGDAEEEN